MLMDKTTPKTILLTLYSFYLESPVCKTYWSPASTRLYDATYLGIIAYITLRAGFDEASYNRALKAL